MRGQPRRRFASLFVAAAVVGHLSISASADEIRACFEEWPPYQAALPKGGARGLSVELTDRVMAGLGHHISYEALPYQRCLQSVRRGATDMLISSQGEADLLPVRPHKVVWAIGLFVNGDDPRRRVSSLDDFNGSRVGVARQFEFPDPIRDHQGWALESAADDRLNFLKLSHRRVDAVLTDVPWALGLTVEERRGARFVEPAVTVVAQPDAFRPGLEKLRDDYATELAKLIADGTVDARYRETIGLSLSDLSAGALFK